MNSAELNKSEGGALDALSPEFFEARKAELVQRVSDRRFNHVMGVVETAEQLARVYGVDVQRARLAGLLHDWDKGYDDVAIRQRACDLGIDLPELVTQGMPRIMHAYTAAVALKNEWPCIPDEVTHAIYYHTVPDCVMSDLDMVLYCADALEPSRTSAKVADLREQVGVLSLKRLYIEVYQLWTENLLHRKLTIHPSTVEIWNNLMSEIEHVPPHFDAVFTGKMDGSK